MSGRKFLFIRRFILSGLVAIICCIHADTAKASTSTCIADPGIAAFPGAEGYGAVSIGGRCGQVIEVTNLKDYKRSEAKIPGSFRAAIETKGPRIIVFRVGGVIHLRDRLIVKRPHLTIAGQTAPGDGITIRGKSGIVVMAEDVIIRYVRVRLDATNTGSTRTGSTGEGAFLVRNGAHRVILDHCSTAFLRDKNIAGTDKDLMTNNPKTHFMHDITLQRCIFSDSFKTALLMTGPNDYRADLNGFDDRFLLNKRLSVHHNLFVSNDHRNPLMTNGGTEVINNVVHNWRSWASGSSNASSIDYIGNYYRPGPMSDEKEVIIHSSFSVARKHPDNIAVEYAKPSLYLSGNVIDGIFEDYLADNWNPKVINEEVATRRLHWDNATGILSRGGELDKTVYGRHTPLNSIDPLPYPVTIQTAHNAYNTVLEDAGANAGLDCTGNLVPRRDDVDDRAINDTIDGLGALGIQRGKDGLSAIETYVNYLIDRGFDGHLLSDVNGEGMGIYPLVHPDNDNPCEDNDHDGMPDAYEDQYAFLDSDNAADGNLDEDGDGYTNIEEFLNATAPNGSAPVADTSRTPNIIGIVGERLLFDGRNSHDLDEDIVEQFWVFGDGRTIRSPTVTSSFNRAGEHRVTYTVTDATGQSDTESIVVTITDYANTPPPSGTNELPVAIPIWGDRTVNVGDTVTFSGRNSYDPDGNIIFYSWDFGDGSIGLGKRVDHVYTKPGTYTARVTVTDDSGEANVNTDNTQVTTVNP